MDYGNAQFALILSEILFPLVIDYSSVNITTMYMPFFVPGIH